MSKGERSNRQRRAKLAASVAHMVCHALQADLQERYGFAVYDIAEGHPELGTENDIADLEDDRMVFRHSGIVNTRGGFNRFYTMEVVIRTHDDEPKVRYERYVNLLLLEKDGGGLEYTFYVPIIGEKKSVGVESVKELVLPEKESGEDDILSGLAELEEFDHLGLEETES